MIRVYSITKNRPNTVERMLRTLLCVLPPDHRVTIIDDSEHPQLRCDYLESEKVHVLSVSKQLQLLDELESHGRELSEVVRKSTRLLGSSRRWNASGPRNLAFVKALQEASEEDILVFIDDDIAFNTLNAPDEIRTIGTTSGAHVLNSLCDALWNRRIDVVGVKYLGRLDLSVLNHISQLLNRIERGLVSGEPIQNELDVLSKFPDAQPVSLDPN